MNTDDVYMQQEAKPVNACSSNLTLFFVIIEAIE
jgi:hypothetical protein